MTIAVQFPADMQEFGGLKVAMQNSLSNSVDSITAYRKVVSGTFHASATRTANGAWNITGLAGTTHLSVMYDITALTITSGTLAFVVQRLLPDGVSWHAICNQNITATGKWLVQTQAAFWATASGSTAPQAYSEYGAAGSTIYNGPWNDSCRLHISGTGVYSVTFSAHYVAM